jgi:hypothetical protein
MADEIVSVTFEVKRKANMSVEEEDWGTLEKGYYMITISGGACSRTFVSKGDVFVKDMKNLATERIY